MPSSKLKAKLQPKHNLDFEAIGTTWNIALETKPAPSLVRAIQDRIGAFDANYSRFRADSLVSRMAQQPGRYQLPADAERLLNFYQQLYNITNGAVTPLIGNILEAAGYDANYSFKPKSLQRPPEWTAAMDYQFPNLTIYQPVLLDFGAAGKGYLVDLICELLEDYDIDQYCVDASGDLATTTPQRIGLEHPGDSQQIIGICELNNGSLCGSAINRRAWGRFHHIIDPDSLQSPISIRAVWVVADNTMLADGLATALFFTPAATLKHQFHFEYAIVYHDYQLEHSANFPATFFGATI